MSNQDISEDINEDIKVTYISSMGNDLTPVNAARISFGKETDEMTDKDKKLIKYLADHEHMTPFEHQTLTVIIECPLYIRSQIHRHRTFAYNEISRRYTSENLEFYIPPVDDIRQQSKSNKQASDGNLSPELAQLCQDAMVSITDQALKTFQKLLDAGVAKEQARAILPQNLMTKFYMTGNLRNWCHFIRLRLDGHAQKEVGVVAKKIAAIIRERWPVSYAALLKEDLP